MQTGTETASVGRVDRAAMQETMKRIRAKLEKQKKKLTLDTRAKTKTKFNAGNYAIEAVVPLVKWLGGATVLTNVGEAIQQYVRLRAEKTANNSAHKKRDADIKAGLDDIERTLLTAIDEAGVDGFKSAYGNATKQTKTYATVADIEVFAKWAVENERFDMFYKQVSAEAINEYMKATADEENPDGQLPPGINVRRETVVSVRQS